MAPKPALAKTTSIRPNPSSGVLRQRLNLVPLRHVAGQRERLLVAAELRGQMLELVRAARRQRDPVALASGGAGGRRADPARGACND